MQINWQKSFFYLTFDFDCPIFIKRSQEKNDSAHPILNEKELQLCCLLKADFSTKEINMLTRQSLQTIYQRKTQVRQKLSLAEAEDITTAIV